MQAAAWKDAERLKTLIAEGADLSQTDSSGWSALMYAASVASDFPVQILLKAGADPNQSSPHGDTPLMASAMAGFWDRDLVKAGALINAKNKDGQTVLMILASRAEVDGIREALQAGADASLRDAQGRTGLDYLRLASCGKSPLYDPITDSNYSFTKCTALGAKDVRSAEKILKAAIHKLN
jgi:ankyrin repeat protein